MDSVSLRLWQRPTYVRLAYLCLLAVVIPVLVWNGFVQHINSAFTDILLRMRPSAGNGAVREVVLLAIDDGTLARYGPMPLRSLCLAEKRCFLTAPWSMLIIFAISSAGWSATSLSTSRARSLSGSMAR